ncbi:unnamed protein product [Aphanomyces euteiches]|uniref:Uncharacterized protein n=1 Tax=Aphanomyces euteiches TaxID=100861 RepID=A0A6G0WP34_9STRA|nr:hypothetical protein Ae201684_013108 [Aphanomyces euteiches]KAH9076413.1 hypothetical protein Ae201684P_010359 [Aphanomyces euteiches]
MSRSTTRYKRNGANKLLILPFAFDMFASIVTLAAIALSAVSAGSLPDIEAQFNIWLQSPAGQAATRLQVIPPNAVNNPTLLARFSAASSPTEAALALGHELLVASWPALPTNERASWLQIAAHENLLRTVESDPADTSKLYLSVASTTSPYSILCANPPFCLHRVNVSASAAAILDNPFVLLTPSETTTYLDDAFSSGAVRSALLTVEDAPVLLLEFQTA